MASTTTPSISLDEEARLYTTNTEREKYETLATLYGIIVSLDYLERAYVRDAISAAQFEFTPVCAEPASNCYQVLSGMHPTSRTV